MIVTDHILYPHHNVYTLEKRGFCLMKSSSETLQNLPYFIYMKTQTCFSHFSFHATLFFPNECPGLCTLDISKIFWLLWYFTPVHKSMPKPNVSSKVNQKMDWKHGYLARSCYILVWAVLGRAGGWKLMLPC